MVEIIVYGYLLITFAVMGILVREVYFDRYLFDYNIAPKNHLIIGLALILVSVAWPYALFLFIKRRLFR